ncbi:MAG TPA: nucleotidyltransferase domain-containing protein [Caldilineaceae bacterium]|nr:nucleotidyltransferase domain-containing protein [Caldilineaceae bacterium]
MSGYLHPTDEWPTGGTPLVKEAQSAYFLPVTEEILAEITRRIVEAVEPEKVILFGSYAYGSPDVDSDVDLLIIADMDERPAERGVIISRLIWPRPFPVDILVKTPAEVEAALERDTFLREVLQRGRVLYERSK